MFSAWEKEENMKTVESLLEKGLIEVANKEEELKVGCVEKYKNTERVVNCKIQYLVLALLKGPLLVASVSNYQFYFDLSGRRQEKRMKH